MTFQLFDFTNNIAWILLILNRDGALLQTMESGSWICLNICHGFDLLHDLEFDSKLRVTEEFKFPFQHINFLEGGSLSNHNLHNPVGLC